MPDDFHGTIPARYQIEIKKPTGEPVYVGRVESFVSLSVAIEKTGGVFLIAGQEDTVKAVYELAKGEIEKCKVTQ